MSSVGGLPRQGRPPAPLSSTPAVSPDPRDLASTPAATLAILRPLHRSRWRDAMRTRTACLPVLLVAGCYEDSRTRLVSGGPAAPALLARANRHVSTAPATEATARRVLDAGQKVVARNPRLGLRQI